MYDFIINFSIINMNFAQKPQRIIIVFAFTFAILSLSLVAYVGFDYGQSSSVRSNVGGEKIIEVSVPVEYFTTSSYAFELDSNNWKVISRENSSVIKLQNINSKSNLYIFESDLENRTLDNYVESKTNSLTQTIGAKIISKELLSVNGKEFFRVELSINEEASQIIYITTTKEKIVEFIYDTQITTQSKTELEGFISSIGF